MRALVVRAPYEAAVVDVPTPVAGSGEVLIDVERAGICGTDVEIFTGEMAYLRTGEASYPLRIGHEWCGRVSAVGPGVDDGWRDRRVTGDTMIGCGHCARCRSGRHHLCADRYEVGVRRGWPGALAEQLVMPVRSLHPLPEELSPAAGALVEPGGNAVRAVRAAAVAPGGRLLVLGAGTIGLLCVLFAVADGAQVEVCDVRPEALALAERLGAATTRLIEGPNVAENPGAGPAPDAVIDASTAPSSPARSVRLVEPGGRVVWIGLSGTPSPLDSRDVPLKDVTVTGILGGSAGLAAAVTAYGSGRVVPDPLVAELVGLEGVAAALAGHRSAAAAAAPKVQVDPSRG